MHQSILELNIPREITNKKRIYTHVGNAYEVLFVIKLTTVYISDVGIDKMI